VGWEGATPKYEFINISKYKSFNISNTNQYSFNNWNFNLGLSFTWISQLIDTQEIATDDRYLFNFNLNTGASYTVPEWNTTFSAYYKHTGKSQQWMVGSSEYVISDIESYGWLDVSIRKSFWGNKLEATIGARNLLD